MSLAVIFRDTMVADQRCMLSFPHAFGQTYRAPKLRVSKDKTFAFASVGPTMSSKEQDVLEAIILQAFKNTKGDRDIINIGHSSWFEPRKDLSLYVMTKKSNYYAHLVLVGLTPSTGLPGYVRELTESALVAFDSDYPAGAGTGMQSASVALLEGVPMDKLTGLISEIIATVGPEYDIVHRRNLKGMKL